MTKNKLALIEARTRIMKLDRINIDTYAAFSIVLKKRGLKLKDIQLILFDTQRELNYSASTKSDILERCFLETGIELRLDL